MNIDYTDDRHTALLLVARDRVTAVDSVMCRAGGRPLTDRVFTALLALENGGYIERRVPPLDSFRCWPVQLTSAGIELLNRFEHVRGSQELTPVQALTPGHAIQPQRGTG